MKTLFSKLSMPFTALLMLGLAAPGCDQSDSGEPIDRGARVVMELDGEAVQSWDVADAQVLEAEISEWVAAAPTPDTCESGEAELGFVLEQDGEALASFEGCAAADGAPAQGSDALTAEPDVQGTFWCTYCEQSNDCYACCRCAGGDGTICRAECLPM